MKSSVNNFIRFDFRDHSHFQAPFFYRPEVAGVAEPDIKSLFALFAKLDCLGDGGAALAAAVYGWPGVFAPGMIRITRLCVTHTCTCLSSRSPDFGLKILRCTAFFSQFALLPPLRFAHGVGITHPKREKRASCSCASFDLWPLEAHTLITETLDRRPRCQLVGH